MSALNFVIPQQPKHDGGNDGRISAQKFVVFLTKRKLAAHSEAKNPFNVAATKLSNTTKTVLERAGTPQFQKQITWAVVLKFIMS